MDYTDFFAEYKHPHTRHDPVGSEDSDVNNDGKVDKNDKYIVAKRQLYKQYQAAQKTKQTTDFSTPKLENDMIRLSGLVNLRALKEETKEPQVVAPATDDKKGDLETKLKKLKSMQMNPDQEKKVDEMLAQMEGLTGGQKKLDVDGDGEIEGSDLAMLRAKKDEVVLENDDHEVPMAHSALDSIIRHATELKGKVGMQDKDLPAWIQDHITNAENYIDQANTGYHEYSQGKSAETDKPAVPGAMNEEAPTGWEKTVLAMKKHKEIDNPWALAHWMKKKGYQHKKDGEK
jgi:hypothetical protein